MSETKIKTAASFQRMRAAVVSQTFRRLRRWSRCEKNANQAVLSTAVGDSGSRKMFGTSDGILGERLVSKATVKRQN